MAEQAQTGARRMSKHTPGPRTCRQRRGSDTWFVEGPGRKGRLWLIGTFLSRSAEENEANARLDAAAPEMYEALVSLVGEPGGSDSFLTPEALRARALLARIDGEDR